MPYVNNQGVRIHYRVEGAGPPLVLQHAFTGSLASWYEFGYVSALERDYKLRANKPYLDSSRKTASTLRSDKRAQATSN